GVDDLIGLTHLHEPAILHALRLRYNADIIYTSTGPILLAINPFKSMDVYGRGLMDLYRRQGEEKLTGGGRGSNPASPRNMLDTPQMPTNQSILVSGESGAGKTVTTKIVLNYFAMLSRKLQESLEENNGVLQSNPILEAFGNARTMRNDNSSRFGKYINIAFTDKGQLLRASIDTYLLEKVRLLHQAKGERNFHIFYQLLDSATREEREELLLDHFTVEDFNLTNQSETYDRRDNILDTDMHQEMVDAMKVMNFGQETVSHLMRLVVAVLFAGNMTFTEQKTSYTEACVLEYDEASKVVAKLLGVSFENLAASLTSKVIFARGDIIHKGLDVGQAQKANEALIKSIYGAAFDFIAERINVSINGVSPEEASSTSTSAGHIFGFETFEVNNFEQLCINYTNETLQQQFNKFVFKLEQQEYEREGILWKFIPFPDNQDVLDLIDKPRTGILQLLDEQCMVSWGSDDKFSLSLYSNCEKNDRFTVGSAQRVRNQFSVEHYAGPVEYTVESWLEKNKDQLPAASVELLESSDFELIGQIKKYVRSEGAKLTTKSLGKQFSDSLKILRSRIDTTVPHYVRCLKPNDELAPDNFDPKEIVDQLRYCGVLEAVRVSRAGYPTRYPHDVFMSRFYMLCPNHASDVHALARPETLDEFLMLDFSSRCAVAGLQLGKTKVFLRRDAFDFIEAIRNEKFGKNVTKISKTWRRHYTRKEGAEFRQKKDATIKIQGVMRGRLARKSVFMTIACIVRLQSLLRTIRERRAYEERRLAIIKMQCFARVIIAKNRREDAIRARAATKIQSIARMRREQVKFKKQKVAAIKVQSVLRMRFAKKQL
ncbi:predicted protein, partial [Thalassiosira pseudonana CCMP1335]